MRVMIVGYDRKIYDVDLCAGCYEVVKASTPQNPSTRGWHGIMDAPELSLP